MLRVLEESRAYHREEFMYIDERIKSLVGVPFVDGGRDENGYDCWGLVREIYRRYNIVLPDYKIACYDVLNVTQEMENNRKNWIKCSIEDAPVPCIAAFRVSASMVNHVGIYIGNGKFIHTREKSGAVIENLDSPIWRHRLEGLYAYKFSDTKKSV